MKGRYVVFDRDGTLIKHIPYLFKADQLELFNDTISSIKLLKSNGFKFFLHTNQSGISRNFFKLKDVIACNNRLIEMIGLGNNIFEEICIAEDYPAKDDSYFAGYFPHAVSKPSKTLRAKPAISRPVIKV